MAQYLLAVCYADRKFPPEEFQRLCVDVPAFDAKLEDAGAFVFHGGRTGLPRRAACRGP